MTTRQADLSGYILRPFKIRMPSLLTLLVEISICAIATRNDWLRNIDNNTAQHNLTYAYRYGSSLARFAFPPSLIVFMLIVNQHFKSTVT